jgi:plasmid stabilization system protein ParE
MKVHFTAAALADINEIREFLLSNYPTVAPLVEQRIRTVTERLRFWPESSPRVFERPEIRATPLGRYPYRIFYTIKDEAVEILHIHHTSRRAFWIEES